MNWPEPVIQLRYVAALLLGSAITSALLIRLLKPWLVRYALARPNARSSHTIPTPQGGGIAIVVTVATVIGSSIWHGHPAFQAVWPLALLWAIGVLAAVGAVDDIRPLPVLPRLGLQFAAAALLMFTLPGPGRLMPFTSEIAEAVVLTVALVWFINLTNFMDGVDLMTVVEVVPVTATLAGFVVLGLVTEPTALAPIALALLGAVLGFAPSNRHVAKLFLGDVGSLPIGAVLGWMLVMLACAGHWPAAVILPLYYLADATITLCRRLLAAENIAQAHRSHFYQRAVQGGFTVPQVTTCVFALNIVLAGLATVSVLATDPQQRYLPLVAAAAATLVVLLVFNRGRSGRATA